MKRDLQTMQYLAAMPFLDRLELAAVLQHRRQDDARRGW